MTPPQIIRADAGEELVLSRTEYDALLARAGGAVDEDAIDARIAAEAKASLARGDDVAMPEDVWEKIEAGTHPVAAIGRWRRLTQQQLAAVAGVSQAYRS